MSGVTWAQPNKCRRTIAVVDGVAPRRRRPLPMQYKHSPTTFAARLIPRAGGCRDWPGPFQTGELPYGKTSYRGKTIGAHVFAWMFANGVTERPELNVCHTCDRPQCCEPTHLFLGTQAANIADAVAKGRMARGSRSGARTHPEARPRGERQWAARLTERDVIAIRNRWVAGDVTLRQLGIEYGVSLQAVWRIVHAETWRHLLPNTSESITGGIA